MALYRNIAGFKGSVGAFYSDYRQYLFTPAGDQLDPNDTFTDVVDTNLPFNPDQDIQLDLNTGDVKLIQAEDTPPPVVFVDPGYVPPTGETAPPPYTMPPVEIPVTTYQRDGAPEVVPTSELPIRNTAPKYFELPDLASLPAATEGDVLPTPKSQAIDWLPILTIGGLLLTAFKGEQLLGNKRKLVYLGGIGLLYYQFAKKK